MTRNLSMLYIVIYLQGFDVSLSFVNVLYTIRIIYYLVFDCVSHMRMKNKTDIIFKRLVFAFINSIFYQ